MNIRTTYIYLNIAYRVSFVGAVFVLYFRVSGAFTTSVTTSTPPHQLLLFRTCSSLPPIPCSSRPAHTHTTQTRRFLWRHSTGIWGIMWIVQRMRRGECESELVCKSFANHFAFFGFLIFPCMYRKAGRGTRVRKSRMRYWTISKWRIYAEKHVRIRPHSAHTCPTSYGAMRNWKSRPTEVKTM